MSNVKGSTRKVVKDVIGCYRIRMVGQEWTAFFAISAIIIVLTMVFIFKDAVMLVIAKPRPWHDTLRLAVLRIRGMQDYTGRHRYVAA